MNRDQLRAAINEAATYHADEGTSGYLLTEGQVDAIMRAAGEYAGSAPRREDQPLPKPGTGPSMHDLAIADLTASGWPGSTAAAELLAARKRIGIDRYGSILQCGNGRDSLRDLVEELGDGVVYARQAIEEGRLPGVARAVIRAAYGTLLRLLSQVCDVQEAQR